jgi:hypothetical protein
MAFNELQTEIESKQTLVEADVLPIVKKLNNAQWREALKTWASSIDEANKTKIKNGIKTVLESVYNANEQTITWIIDKVKNWDTLNKNEAKIFGICALLQILDGTGSGLKEDVTWDTSLASRVFQGETTTAVDAAVTPPSNVEQIWSHSVDYNGLSWSGLTWTDIQVINQSDESWTSTWHQIVFNARTENPITYTPDTAVTIDYTKTTNTNTWTTATVGGKNYDISYSVDTSKSIKLFATEKVASVDVANTWKITTDLFTQVLDIKVPTSLTYAALSSETSKITSSTTSFPANSTFFKNEKYMEYPIPRTNEKILLVNSSEDIRWTVSAPDAQWNRLPILNVQKITDQTSLERTYLNEKAHTILGDITDLWAQEVIAECVLMNLPGTDLSNAINEGLTRALNNTWENDNTNWYITLNAAYESAYDTVFPNNKLKGGNPILGLNINYAKHLEIATKFKEQTKSKYVSAEWVAQVASVINEKWTSQPSQQLDDQQRVKSETKNNWSYFEYTYIWTEKIPSSTTETKPDWSTITTEACTECSLDNTADFTTKQTSKDASWTVTWIKLLSSDPAHYREFNDEAMTIGKEVHGDKIYTINKSAEGVFTSSALEVKGKFNLGGTDYNGDLTYTPGADGTFNTLESTNATAVRFKHETLSTSVKTVEFAWPLTKSESADGKALISYDSKATWSEMIITESSKETKIATPWMYKDPTFMLNSLATDATKNNLQALVDLKYIDEATITKVLTDNDTLRADGAQDKDLLTLAGLYFKNFWTTGTQKNAMIASTVDHLDTIGKRWNNLAENTTTYGSFKDQINALPPSIILAAAAEKSWLNAVEQQALFANITPLQKWKEESSTIYRARVNGLYKNPGQELAAYIEQQDPKKIVQVLV